MIYDVIREVNLPGLALHFAVGDEVTSTKLGQRLIDNLLLDGAIRLQPPKGKAAPPRRTEPRDEAAEKARLDAYNAYSEQLQRTRRGDIESAVVEVEAWQEFSEPETAPEVEVEAEPIAEPVTEKKPRKQKDTDNG